MGRLSADVGGTGDGVGGGVGVGTSGPPVPLPDESIPSPIDSLLALNEMKQKRLQDKSTFVYTVVSAEDEKVGMGHRGYGKITSFWCLSLTLWSRDWQPLTLGGRGWKRLTDLVQQG